ncbi:MAG: hypothetical protein H6857_01025 [Rhodospirillales bacterium]|nr:hypothetical protein [Rhodospirillales bacterium]
MKILWFLLVNGIGFFSTAIVWYYAVHNNMVPNANNLSPEKMTEFPRLFFGGTLGVWIVSGLFSVLFFFIRKGFGAIFLLLPLIAPFVYAMVILNMFNP